MIIKNKIKFYTTKLHLWLSGQLRLALIEKNQDKNYISLLFLSYISCLAILFFTQKDPSEWSYDPAHKLYIYVLIPIIFVPIKFSNFIIWKISVPVPSQISFYNIFRNFILCRNFMFGCVLVFTLSQAVITYLLNPHPLQFYIFFYYFLAPLIIFIVATVRLCVDYPDFYYVFFRFSGVIVAINAGINLIIYLRSASGFAFLAENRIGSAYGYPFGNNPNVDGVIYTNFLIGTSLAFFRYKTKLDFLLFFISITLLAITVILEQTRSEILGLISAYSILVLLNFEKYKWKSFYPLIIVLLAIIVYSQLCLQGGIYHYFLRGDADRFIIWKNAMHYVKLSPLLGIGIKDNLSIVIPHEIHFHAHSIPIGAIIRGGIVGLLSLIFIYLSGILYSYRYAKINKNSIPICLFVSFIVSGLFDHELKIGQAGWEWVAFWLPISLSLGAEACLKNKIGGGISDQVVT